MGRQMSACFFGKNLLYTTKGRSRKFGSARWGRNVYRIFGFI